MRPGLRRRRSGENAHAVRSEVLEPESRALEQTSERRVSAESGGNSMGFLVPCYSRDVDEVQVGLAGKRGQRLRQRLRGNIGDQLRGFNGLGDRRGNRERNGRAQWECTEYSGHGSRDLCRWMVQALPRLLTVSGIVVRLGAQSSARLCAVQRGLLLRNADPRRSHVDFHTREAP